MARPARPTPRTICGDTWPNATTTDPAVAAAQHLARQLANTLKERQLSLRGTEAITGVDHDTISRILNGTTWPDTRTLAMLETGLVTKLWFSPTEQPPFGH